MIMNWRKAYFEAFRLVLYITVKGLYVKNTGRFLPVFFIRQILIPGAVLHT